MNNLIANDDAIKNSLTSAKTIAMIGVSSQKKEVSSNIVRRPSIIVMNYLQEFGYRVIPVNPFSAGKTINGEKVLSSLDKIPDEIDIVDVFRPSNEAPGIANEAVKKKSKVLWLQYGIHNTEAEKIVKDQNMDFVSNKCIKQEYQRLFQKSNPVFPVLRS